MGNVHQKAEELKREVVLRLGDLAREQGGEVRCAVVEFRIDGVSYEIEMGSEPQEEA